MKKYLTIIFLLLLCIKVMAQKKVAFTIDDVPNIILYNNEGFHHRLLDKIDSMHLPVAVFINEAGIFYTDSITRNFSLFCDWIRDENVTPGNHGFNHAMYSKIGIDSFKTEVLKGEAITKELCKKYNKQQKYFRFPYNDLGKDALQHQQAEDFLTSKNYIITPFTVHSEDWLITKLYAYYKTHNMDADAKRVGNTFIKKTLEYFDYIEGLTSSKQNRDVAQVYLMHDVLLNADYIDTLVAALKQKNYSFITLDEAIKDPVYKSKDYYRQQSGISWVYRWIKDDKERKTLIRKEPDISDFERELSTLKKE